MVLVTVMLRMLLVLIILSMSMMAIIVIIDYSIIDCGGEDEDGDGIQKGKRGTTTEPLPACRSFC